MKTYIVEVNNGGLVVVSARGKKHAKRIVLKEFSFNNVLAEILADNVKELTAGKIKRTFKG